jgi:prepilin-type processing-associated H-X9-DG protein
VKTSIQFGCAVLSQRQFDRFLIHCSIVEGRLFPSAARIEILESRRLLATAIFVNAGGGTLVDSLHRSFQAGVDFTGGHDTNIAPVEIENTWDDALFHSSREGTGFAYSAAVANGRYTLFLEFAEPANVAAGARVFDVAAEGATVLSHFDIIATAGAPQAAVVRRVDIEITDGQLNLAFNAVAGEALINAIVLLPRDIPTEALPYSHLAMSDSQKVIASASNLRQIAVGLLLYAGDNRGKYPSNLSLLGLSSDLPLSSFTNPRTGTLLPRGETTQAELAGFVAAQDDYIYLGAGKNWAMPADAPLAYENPNREYGDINALWGDGHVSTLTRADAAAALGFVNAPPSDPPPPPPSIGSTDPAVVGAATHLTQIRDAIYLYSRDYGRYPSRLSQLYENNLITDLSIFTSPRRSTPLPPTGATQAEKIAWIDSTSDFLFGPRGQRNGYSDDVMLAENPAGLTGGINLILIDGRCVFREMPWALATLGRLAPAVSGVGFNHRYAPQSLTFSFKTPGVALETLQASDIVLQNLSTGQIISAFASSYNVIYRNWTVTFPNQPYGALPDGNYRVTLLAGSVADALGNPLASDATLDFTFLNGDANRDRIVDTQDFNILVEAFGYNGDFTWGDFTYNGVIDSADFNVLVQQFGKKIAAAPVAGAILFSPVAISSDNEIDDVLDLSA